MTATAAVHPTEGDRMTLHVYADLEQGSEEWLAARCGLVTASVIGSLIVERTPDPVTVACPSCGASSGEPCVSAARKTPTPIKTTHAERNASAGNMPTVLQLADSDTSTGLTYTLAAERITGFVDYVHPTWDMQRGTDDEPFARIAYAEHHAPVHEVGFMIRDLGDGVRIGYSPDGLVGEDGLIEIKSRKPKEQIRAIISDRVPPYNMAQMQAGLLVSGRAWIDYVSYRDGLPLYVSRVYPDRAWFEAIEAAARAFETNVTVIVDQYTRAAGRYVATERRPDLEDIRI